MKYKATLTNLGKKYSSEGATIQEALSGITPRTIAGASVLVVEHGDKKHERIIQMRNAKQAFTAVGMIKEVGIKNLSLMFTGI